MFQVGQGLAPIHLDSRKYHAWRRSNQGLEIDEARDRGQVLGLALQDGVRRIDPSQQREKARQCIALFACGLGEFDANAGFGNPGLGLFHWGYFASGYTL